MNHQIHSVQDFLFQKALFSPQLVVFLKMIHRIAKLINFYQFLSQFYSLKDKFQSLDQVG